MKMASPSWRLELFFVMLFCSSGLLLGATSELQALMAFKSTVDDESKAISDWGNGSSLCSWTGISCREGNVVSLSLPHLGLQGILAPELGSLLNLEVLNLANNQFSGSIPFQLWKLQNLETLDLSSNLLTGALPSGIQNLKRIQKLDLSSNSFSGRIDTALFSCSSLQSLDLHSNSFTGEIPNQISGLSKLQILGLGDNELSGPIPSAIGNLLELLVLDLGNGFLSGNIPASIGELKRLHFLDISNNSIAGNIPPSIGGLTSLKYLRIGHNRFSGTLPREIGNLKNLFDLDAPSCRLNGPIPDEIGELQALAMIDLSGNLLQSPIPRSIGKLQNLKILSLVGAGINGSIPAELGNCKKLKGVFLTFNDLSGVLPDNLAKLSDSILSFSIEQNRITGKLPSWLGTWHFAESILLASNQFHGRIPPELGNCSSLTYLSLNHNQLTGSIPSELCNCKFLSELDLENNLLTGMISDTFQNCRNLTQLVLYQNQLTGAIPKYLSKLPLMIIELDNNNFTGEIPAEIWSSNSLLEISMGFNFLQGSLSSKMGDLVTLQRLVLNNNRLEGTIPKVIGNLQNLMVLSMNQNQLSGEIPVELFKCRSMTSLDLGNNKLTGSIPTYIRNLTQLEYLVLSHNYLSGPLPIGITEGFRQSMIPETSYLQHRGVFDLSWNRLSGQIPEQLGNCFVIVSLLLGNNNLSGEIPASIFKLPNLTFIDLSSNRLEGKIPVEVGLQEKLQGLMLANNHLHGNIPMEIGKLKNLVKLNLSGNFLMGEIPASISKLQAISDLDLSNNKLSGRLPPSLSKLTNIVRLYLQQNQISGDIHGLLTESASWRQIETVNLSMNFLNGDIPSSISNLSYLNYLDLHGNRFTGTITRYISNLSQLLYLDMSENLFHGQIPHELCYLSDLKFLNLSSNMFCGPILNCGKLMQGWFLDNNNNNLCRSLVKENFTEKSRQLRWLLDMPAILILLFSTCFSILCLILAFFKWRNLLQESMNPIFKNSAKNGEALHTTIDVMFEKPLLQLTLPEILRLTDSFSKSNVIGEGGSGTVYRGVLPNGRMVAIKKLGKSRDKGRREFLAEIEAIGKVKHKNLVGLLGYCISGDEKILIYEFMVNGSLEFWLRNKNENLQVLLDWNRRLNIATGTAKGLAYLHHGIVPHVIHRDVKTSNILLDNEFEPRVSDFGLARIIRDWDTHVTTEIAGTFGYIAPEYGHSWRSTTKGDVYSFGVMLLELVTGREPTDSDFKDVEGGNLVGWVREMAKKGKDVECLDAATACEGSSSSNSMLCVGQMLEVLHLGIGCTSEEPVNRPCMQKVVQCLEHIGEITRTTSDFVYGNDE